MKIFYHTSAMESNDRFDVSNSQRYQHTRCFIRGFSEGLYTEIIPCVIEAEQLLFDMNVGMDPSGQARPIDFAVLEREDPAIEICVALGANLNLRTWCKMSPYEFALSKGYGNDSPILDILSGKQAPRPVHEILSEACAREIELRPANYKAPRPLYLGYL